MSLSQVGVYLSHECVLLFKCFELLSSGGDLKHSLIYSLMTTEPLCFNDSFVFFFVPFELMYFDTS